MENIHLIKKIANSFAITTEIPYDDLFQEAAIAYLEACKTHDLIRGKLSTHIWNCVSNHLKNYVKQETKHTTLVIPLIDYSLFETDDVIEDAIKERDFEDVSVTNYISFIESLSKDSLGVFAILVDCQNELICLPVEEAKQKIKDKLKEMGWSMKRIFASFNDLQAINS